MTGLHWSGAVAGSPVLAILLLSASAGVASDRPPTGPLDDEMGQLSPSGVFRDCDVCPEMVVVPDGSYMRGLNGPGSCRGRGQEQPRHRVIIPRPFAVSKYEVTFDEWEACLADGGCRGHRPFDWHWGRGRRPVINVSWDDARAYALWLTQKTGKPYRLLSEAEWEHAARAGTGGPYHFGDTISADKANFDETFSSRLGRLYRRKTVPVGSFPPNEFGLHDMHGNVWEWVEDCRHHSYHGAPTDGSAWAVGSPWTDGRAWIARSAGRCSSRGIRGGSWYSGHKTVTSGCRSFLPRDNRGHANGIRVARDLGP